MIIEFGQKLVEWRHSAEGRVRGVYFARRVKIFALCGTIKLPAPVLIRIALRALGYYASLAVFCSLAGD